METGNSTIVHGKHCVVDFVVKNEILESFHGMSGQFNLTARARMLSVLKLQHTNFEILSREG
jgi:formamidopyrimidine-DNA glycosylase